VDISQWLVRRIHNPPLNPRCLLQICKHTSQLGVSRRISAGSKAREICTWRISRKQPRARRSVEAAAPTGAPEASDFMRSEPETDCRDAARAANGHRRADAICSVVPVAGTEGECSCNCTLAVPHMSAYHCALCGRRNADDTGVALPQRRARVRGRPPLPAGDFFDENDARGPEWDDGADSARTGDCHFESAGKQNPLIRIEISADDTRIPWFASLAVADMGSGLLSGNPVAGGHVSGAGTAAVLIHYQDRQVSARQPT
jgi:hypothetical protein